MDSLKNNGIAQLNWQDPEDSGVTIIVVGLARSGTSMIASSLLGLGVFIGDQADHAVYEDLRLTKELEAGRLREASSIIGDYNNRFSKWAFKRPGAYKYIERYIEEFRNPRLIIPFRDHLAIAKRNEISMMMDLRSSLLAAQKESEKLLEFTERLNAPVMLVSYEKCVLDPVSFVASLRAYIGLSVDQGREAQVAAKIKNGPAAYLYSSQVRFPRDKIGG